MFSIKCYLCLGRVNKGGPLATLRRIPQRGPTITHVHMARTSPRRAGLCLKTSAGRRPFVIQLVTGAGRSLHAWFTVVRLLEKSASTLSTQLLIKRPDGRKDSKAYSSSVLSAADFNITASSIGICVLHCQPQKAWSERRINGVSTQDILALLVSASSANCSHNFTPLHYHNHIEVYSAVRLPISHMYSLRSYRWKPHCFALLRAVLSRKSTGALASRNQVR